LNDITMLEYEAAAMKTRLPTAGSEYVTLGLIGEIGEFYGKWAKCLRDGREWDDEDMKKELGDILWMLTALCRESGSSLSEVASMNVKKLEGRAKRKTLQGSGDNR
jgi:NTP pyrophosphatase (non-canonical NTP hydrolase)